MRKKEQKNNCEMKEKYIIIVLLNRIHMIEKDRFVSKSTKRKNL